ncbi:hypothetical protein J6590_024172 [Homalodisca vitripennis]|nr:hypothetical protein J6590_024172 [Homalodisca vitripennis]
MRRERLMAVGNLKLSPLPGAALPPQYSRPLTLPPLLLTGATAYHNYIGINILIPSAESVGSWSSPAPRNTPRPLTLPPLLLTGCDRLSQLHRHQYSNLRVQNRSVAGAALPPPRNTPRPLTLPPLLLTGHRLSQLHRHQYSNLRVQNRSVAGAALPPAILRVRLPYRRCYSLDANAYHNYIGINILISECRIGR